MAGAESGGCAVCTYQGSDLLHVNMVLDASTGKINELFSRDSNLICKDCAALWQKPKVWHRSIFATGDRLAFPLIAAEGTIKKAPPSANRKRDPLQDWTDRPTWRDLIRDESWWDKERYAVLSTDGQRRVWQKARMSKGEDLAIVLHALDRGLSELIVINLPRVCECLGSIEAIYSNGFSKDAIASTLFGSGDLRKALIHEKQLKPLRGSVELPLIHSHRFRPGDLDHWKKLEMQDRLYLKRNLGRLKRLEEKALEAIASFLSLGEAYCSVSWGIDSVVVARMAQQVTTLGHTIILPCPNPETPAVRDAFLNNSGCKYCEFTVDDRLIDSSDEKKRHAALFALMSASLGDRYISGVRAEESADRRQRGSVNTKNVSTPILKWTRQDTFAYAILRDLPIHPNYAMTDGGQFDRHHLRVSSLSGTRGNNRDRKVWTDLYYGDYLSATLNHA